MSEVSLDQLRRVLKGDGFSVVFQPIVELNSGARVGYEALSRFDDDATHSPADWFADGRDHGFGVEMEAMAVQTAMDELQPYAGGPYLSVNVCAETLVKPAFGAAIPLDLHGVSFDISEYSALSVPEIAWVARSIRERGGMISVDDVAGERATLRQLLDLDCDQIKLDMDLLRRAPTENRTRALIRGIAAFASEAGLAMVAKGIEHEHERDLAVELGIPFGQGYLFGRPRAWAFAASDSQEIAVATR